MSKTPHERSAAGTRAQQALDATGEAFQALEAEYWQAWKDSSPRDTEGRERLYQAVQIVNKVQEHLRLMADDGKVARQEIEEIERYGERRKIFGVV